MYSYYTTTHLGKTVHIIQAKADTSHDVQISLMAERYDSADPLKVASDFRDGYLEANGWTRVGVMNGGIFNGVYANGVEKAFWNEHEPNDDAPLDDVMAVGHSGSDNNYPVLELQDTIQATLGSYRGAVTGAFGLLKGGAVVQGNTSKQGNYSSLSGRSILALGWDNSIYFMSVAGVTGSSGLTGAQCLDLVQGLGLKDAICMDGGGSVSLIFQDEWKVSTTRQIKNAWGLYARQKTDPGGGGGEVTVPPISRDSYIPVFGKSFPHKIMIGNIMCDIQDIKLMVDGNLVSILQAKEVYDA